MSPADDRTLRNFAATTETRCVRDIKRIFSWKIYGLVCDDGLRKKPAHYVRVSFDDRQKDKAFEMLSELLDCIAAKRHVALTNINPFGIGMDTGVQGSRERIYLINNCAKQTPALRRVVVDFEIYIDNEWKRLDLRVDRFGFATYKSAPKADILNNDHEDIHFNDDPFVRFARVTLRFGDRPERAYIDIEGGEKSIPYLSRTRKASIVYLPKVRVRTSDGSDTRRPIRTMTRIIFREKESGFLRSSGKAAAVEAEKLAILIRKTTRLAAKNSLGIRYSIKDSDIMSMRMRGAISQKGFIINHEESSHKLDTRNMFKDGELFAHPSQRNGITLVVQSRTGEFVLRQHIDNPVDLISSVTAGGFSASSMSTLITTRPVATNGVGTGTFHYAFAHGEADAAQFVDMIVRLITSIDATQQLPSRLPQLTKVLAEKQRNNMILRTNSTKRARVSPAKRTPPKLPPVLTQLLTASDTLQKTTMYTHSRTSSDASASSATSDREPTDWAIYEAPDDAEIFEAPSTLPSAGSGASGVTVEKLLHELEGGSSLCRVRKKYDAKLPREVDLQLGEMVKVEYRNNYWCFVKRSVGGEGWVPTGFLEC